MKILSILIYIFLIILFAVLQGAFFSNLPGVFRYIHIIHIVMVFFIFSQESLLILLLCGVAAGISYDLVIFHGLSIHGILFPLLLLFAYFIKRFFLSYSLLLLIFSSLTISIFYFVFAFLGTMLPLHALGLVAYSFQTSPLTVLYTAFLNTSIVLALYFLWGASTSMLNKYFWYTPFR